MNSTPARQEQQVDPPVSGALPAGALRQRPVRFTRLSITEGLSQSVVNDILQDRQGYLWFATQDGLNRYDGYNFTVYRHDPNDPGSLSHSNVNRILEDRQGYLWVGTHTAGLNRFDPVTGRAARYRNDKKQPHSLGGGAVYDILEDRQGNIWVATMGGGISRYDPQVDGFQHFLNNPDDPDSLVDNEVMDLLEARDGSIWVSTHNGLDRYDPATGRFTHYSAGPGGPSSNYRSYMFEDRRGRIWMGTHDNGLDRLDPVTGQFTHFAGGPEAESGLVSPKVNTVYEDRAGVLWVGLQGGGLCRLEDEETRFKCSGHDPADDQSLSANDVISIYEDRAGSLWVGTFGGGVNRLDPGFKPFVNYRNDPQDPESLSGGLVFALLEDGQGNLWVGTDGEGLDKLERRTGRVTHYRHNPEAPGSIISDRVFELFQDSAGALWAGTTAGLDRLDEDGRFTHYPLEGTSPPDSNGVHISSITEDRQGRLWVGTSDGLAYLDLKADPEKARLVLYGKKTGDPAGPVGQKISALYLDSHDMLWFGLSGKGLGSLDLDSGKYVFYPSDPEDPRALSDPHVMAIHEDRSGTIWVGTTGGLNRFQLSADRTSATIRHYRVRDGLANDFVYAIEADGQGRLWLSTNMGLSRFDPASGEFKNFDVRDGLQSNEFNQGASFKSASGEIFFGGINGVTAFYPDQIIDNPYVPPVVLTSLSQHGERLADGPAETAPGEAGEITIRWPENNIEFEFAALNFIRPENNRYAYTLEGFDREWNQIGSRRSGRYTNLPGGTYRLRLKGSNNDGVWNEAGVSIRLRVVPPVWQTWWFRGMAFLLLVGVVVGGVRLRVRSVESRNQELERLVRTRTQEIERLYLQTKELAIVEERNRLARDLHDSAKQKAFAALAQVGAANGLVRQDPAKTRAALVEAETLVYEVIEELTFLIQEMYPAELKEKGLPVLLREYLYEWESRNGIQVRLQIENERPLPLQLEQTLYRIIQEALANVARHSQARSVDVIVCYEPDRIDITIRDNGKGFDINRRPPGVGLRSMHERVTLVGGSITYESEPGQGTCIFARAPIPLETRQAS